MNKDKDKSIKKTPTKPLIFTSLMGVMNDITSIGKNDKNTMQNFKFRGIDTVYNELHSILVKHKVITIPEVLEERSEERKTKNGGNLIYRILKIKYTFYAEDGSSVYGIVMGEAMDSGDKASNKAMSVAHKYFLLQSFCIPTDEQSDPDYQSHEVKPKQTNKNQTPETLLVLQASVTNHYVKASSENKIPEKQNQKYDEYMANIEDETDMKKMRGVRTALKKLING